MKKNLFFLLFLFSCTVLLANTDKYRLILVDDPATTITIAWNQISGTNPTVYYGTTDFGTVHTLYPFSKSVDRSEAYRGMDNQFARLSGLQPNTAYYFVIHDSEGPSERFWFKTAPDDLSRLSFIAGGDSRNNRGSRQDANLLVSKLKPHAVLFGGDMTDDDTSLEWQNWLDDWQLTTASDGRMFPIIPARGNHETPSVIYHLFDTPNEHSYYALTFGAGLFRTYTLNTEISVSGNQLDWLKGDLEEHPDVIWKAAQYHKPMRPHTSAKVEGQSEYEAWARLFFEKNVRLVIDCDSHMAKTTWPVEPSTGPESEEGFKINEEYGTVYAGEGCWGAPLRQNDDDKSWTRNSGTFNQFKLIFVAEDKIELRTIKVGNADEVGEASNEDPFALPDNLDIWAPSNGAVVEIFPAVVRTPDIEFEEETPTAYVDGLEITLDIEICDEGNGISTVEFYVDHILAVTDDAPPYTFTYTYGDGQHLIEAKATDVDGYTDYDELFINIGSFVKAGNVRIHNGDDDIEETETQAIYFNSSDLEMVYDGYDFEPGTPNRYQKIGLRFQDVNIPAGAIIDNAYIQFRSDEINNEPAALLIRAEDIGNARPFDTYEEATASGRATFTEAVSWVPPAWTATGLTGPAQQTPELGGLLQRVIERGDWKAGNSMAFIIEGTEASLSNPNNKRVVDSYEGSDDHPPTLIFSYSFDATAVVSIEEKNEFFNARAHAFPNPFSNTISFEVPERYSEVAVEISSISGTRIYSKKVAVVGGNFIINPSVMQAGIYVINVYGPGGSRLIHQKMVRN